MHLRHCRSGVISVRLVGPRLLRKPQRNSGAFREKRPETMDWACSTQPANLALSSYILFGVARRDSRGKRAYPGERGAAVLSCSPTPIALGYAVKVRDQRYLIFH